MEQELHKPLLVHENDEKEEEELEHVSFKRTTLSHVKDNNLVTSNGGGQVDSNGVNDPDGNSLEKEEENDGENNNHFIEDREDYAAVGLGLVAGKATNGEAITSDTFVDDVLQKNNTSVYVDKQQGVWKCHHCTWTKRLDKTMTRHEHYFVWETKDNEVNGLDTVQNGDATRSVSPKTSEEIEFDVQEHNSAIQNSLGSQLNNPCMKTVHDEVPSSSGLSGLHSSSEIQTTDVVNFDEEIEKEDNLIQEIDEQLKEYDVEVVLAKQETHDLFCPNCSKCITKRVILKKRKRIIPNLDREPKQVKFDPVFDPNMVDSKIEVNQGDHTNVTSESPALEPPADDDNPERDVEVFRCLSCFSIFIPKGNGFNLFSCFGRGSEHEIPQISLSIPAQDLQNSSSIPARDLQNPSNLPGSNANSNWFSSLFSKGKTTAEQGYISYEHSGTRPSEQHHSTSTTSTTLSSPEISHPVGPVSETAPVENGKTLESIGFSSNEQSLDGKLTTNEKDKRNTSVHTTVTNNVEVMSSTSFSDGTVTKYDNVTSVTSSTSETHSNSTQTVKDGILNPWEEEPEFLEIVNDGDSSSKQGTQSAVIPFGSNNQSSAIDATFPSKPDISPIEKALQNINEKINSSVGNENKGEVRVTIEKETHESTTIQAADNVPVDGGITTESQTQVGIDEQPRDEVGEPRQWEIIKSVVYGGLIESITSLGIVSSAASSGATPLNIIALGFANLIGGLFVLGHKIKDLKNDHYGTEEPQLNPQDRYQEQLGHRRNFLLHVLVALFSFLIFGAVPIVIYGLLINKDYYAEVKLAIVAATSVACIIFLSSLKVYTRRPPKSYFRTVLSYVTMAIAASGLSYMAGNLFKDLLEKFYHPESGFAITMPLSDRGVEKTWTYY